MAMQFDECLMYSAVSNNRSAGGPQGEAGYLNRRTGEIMFVCEKDVEAQRWDGPDAREDNAVRRARLSASPGDWLEIPRNERGPVYHEHWCERRLPGRPRDAECTCGALERARAGELDDDAHIDQFLRQHGLR
jgi:hypothetical protein